MVAEPLPARTYSNPSDVVDAEMLTLRGIMLTVIISASTKIKNLPFFITFSFCFEFVWQNQYSIFPIQLQYRFSLPLPLAEREYFHILLPSTRSRSIKERTICLNYNYENATPRDRNERTAFSNGQNRNCHTCDTADRRDVSCGQKNEYRNEEAICKSGTRYEPHNVMRRSVGCRQRNMGQCGSDNGYLHRETPIAMVYAPVQQWKELYDPCSALSTGTIFKELDLPFYPTPCRRKECGQCHHR